MPFPHVERAALVRRPALVLARRETGTVGPLLWTLMITNAARPEWSGDVAIPDAVARGLLIPSKIRTAKLTVVEAADATRIGRLDPATWRTVATLVRDTIRPDLTTAG